MSAHEGLPAARREASDVGFRPLLIAAISLAVLLVLLAGLAWWLFPGATVDKNFDFRLPRTAAPALQSSPRTDMAAFHARELRQLDSYGWVDQTHGIVHVPIDDAMRRVARDGIAGWPTTAVAP